MVSRRLTKIDDAILQLEEALKAYAKRKGDTQLPFLALSKAFEILVEYAWKELKVKIESEGLEAPSPKETVRQAAKMGYISDPERWIDCINARNLSVHDYFGISHKSFAELAAEFANLVKKALKKLG